MPTITMGRAFTSRSAATPRLVDPPWLLDTSARCRSSVACTINTSGWHKFSTPIDSEAEGRDRAIPKILPRVFLHGAQRVLGVLPALVFVEAPQDLADQVAGRVGLELLGDGDDLHTGLTQLADVELALELIT